MRFPLLPVMVIALLSAGCASVRPGSHETESALAADVADTIDGLTVAQTEYYSGVRAFVAEDFATARTHFHQVREVLAFAGSESIADLAARDAQSLLAKSDYFLGRIAEELPEVAQVDPEELARAAGSKADWEVLHGEIQPVENQAVQRWLQYFTTDGRDVFQRWLSRKPRYDTVFHDTFARYGLPPELAYHAMIESGFSPSAYSWAHAVGMWQFVRSTGRRYGLRSDWWVDERRDPYAATDAAARYLRDLYVEFEDWELALAAYNVGEGRVRSQIRRQKTRDFWKLRLPRETRNHIPKFYAVLILGSDPERHGFHDGDDRFPDWETVSVDFCVDFDVLAECAGTTSEALAQLNPALVRGCSPPDEKGFQVRVPAGSSERAAVALAALPEDQRVRWAHHKVHRGETLSHIADRYRTTVSAIAQANRLRSTHFLSIGQELLIPQGRRSGANPPAWASSGGSSGSNTVTYRVRKGDTLSEIAERYNVSATGIRRANRIGKYIYPGQKLKITTRGSRVASSRPATVKVRRGDTLWDIARLHGVSLTALLEANNLGKTSVIRPGEVLSIP
ncbi:LysM peptidoglycan-binding domain-containing protein [bacterium]|nr:LysM peptidoglycan-binding domain-containing protein [bacterium]